MKNSVVVKFKVIAINSNEAKFMVANELDKKTMLLNYESIDSEANKEYKTHEVLAKFNIEANDKKEAEQIVKNEMVKETMKLRNWEIV